MLFLVKVPIYFKRRFRPNLLLALQFIFGTIITCVNILYVLLIVYAIFIIKLSHIILSSIYNFHIYEFYATQDKRKLFAHFHSIPLLCSMYGVRNTFKIKTNLTFFSWLCLSWKEKHISHYLVHVKATTIYCTMCRIASLHHTQNSENLINDLTESIIIWTLRARVHCDDGFSFEHHFYAHTYRAHIHQSICAKIGV